METTTIVGIEEIDVTLYRGLFQVKFETRDGLFLINGVSHISKDMTKAQSIRKCKDAIETYLSKMWKFKQSDEDTLPLPKESTDFDYTSGENVVYLQPEITGVRALAIIRNGYVTIRDEEGNNYTIGGILRGSLSQLVNDTLEVILTAPDKSKKEIKKSLKTNIFEDFRAFVYDKLSNKEFSVRFDEICEEFTKDDFDFLIAVKTAVWDKKTDLEEIKKNFVYLPKEHGMFMTMTNGDETLFKKIK
jgi:hypothetical protein|tara:strand:- start:2467 stop:3204 length:738 start_codon:yes stop_codon:yes gene_type:complete